MAGDVGEPRGQARRGDGAARRARRPGCGAEPQRGGEAEGERLARGHRLAVQQRLAVAGLGLQRVAEGVAEVSSARRPCSRLVLGDDLRLHLHGTRDGVGEGLRLARQHLARRCASSHSKKAKSPSRPYLITSA